MINPTEHPIHELLANRWSPRRFADGAVSAADLDGLFEAARWTPSCFNDQPWGFIVGNGGDTHRLIADCLVEANRQWAAAAPVLVLGVARTTFRRNGKPNRHAWYDLGQAVGHLTVEASARGLVLHQMAGFDADKARETFAVPDNWDPAVAIAIDHPVDGDDAGERSRWPQADWRFDGAFPRSS